MSTALILDEPHVVSGNGWNAEVYYDHIYLTTSYDGDPLPSAIAALFGPSRRRYWTVEYSHDDALGRPTYYLELSPEAASSSDYRALLASPPELALA